MLNLIAWAVLGIIAGAIAKAIYPGRQGGGILSTMILGIIGAFVGGTLFSVLNGGGLAITAAAPFNLGALIVAIIGALIAIFIWGLLTGRTTI
jgi:uncharacterized membrane protein YeaQ/YmgE (transglycosylase-associated protein family)